MQHTFYILHLVIYLHLCSAVNMICVFKKNLRNRIQFTKNLVCAFVNYFSYYYDKMSNKSSQREEVFGPMVLESLNSSW